MSGKTLYDKLWDAHLVETLDGGSALIYIDRHLLHEVTSPQAFEGLRLAGRAPWRIDANLATPDHNVPTDQAERSRGVGRYRRPGVAPAGADAGRQLSRLQYRRVRDQRPCARASCT